MKNSKVSQSAAGLRWAGLLAFVLVVSGCDYLPPNPPKSATPVANWVDEGRRCNWRYRQQGFFVPDLIDLPFLASVDRALLATNLESASEKKLPVGESIVLERPENLDDDTYRILRRFTEPFQVAEPFADLQAQGEVKALQFVAEGRYLLAVSDTIDLWDAKLKKRLCSYPCPVKELRAAYIHSSREYCYLVGPTEIERLDLSTGAVVDRFKPRSGTIAATDFAETASQIIVVGSEQGAYLIDDALHIVETYPDVHPSPRVAINTGATEFFIAAGGASPRQYRVGDTRVGFLDPPMLSAGENDLVTFEQTAAFFSHDGVLQSPYNPGMATRIDGVFGLEAQAYRYTPWVVCLRHFQSGGEPHTVIQDFMPEYGLGSAPTLLPAEKPACYALCNFGEGIALGYDSKVKIFSRRKWSYATRYDFAYVLADVTVSEDKLDQWESIVTALAKLDQTYDGVTSEVLEVEFVQNLAKRIKRAENPNEHIEPWLESGTPLSALTGVFVECSRAMYFDEISEPTRNTLRHIKVLKAARPNSLALLFSQFWYELKLKGDITKAQSYLAEMMSRYPTFLLPHVQMGNYYRAQLQNEQADNSYMLQVASVYPTEWRDTLRKKTLMNWYQETRILFVTTPVLPSSTERILRQMLTTEYLTEVQLQRIYQFAVTFSLDELRTAASKYDLTIKAAKATRHGL